MRGRSKDRGLSWFIAVVAVVLVAWAALEIAATDAGEAAGAMGTQVGGMPQVDGVDEAIELHRLLPDATGDRGRRIRLDGTVVATGDRRGMWVRDLRDNVVYVTESRDGTWTDRARVGDPVRVWGRIALLTPREHASTLDGTGLVLPASALLVRDVKVLAEAEGIDILPR